MKKITRLLLLIAAIVAWGNVAYAVNTECAGTLTTAAQGAFTLGYNYTFTTSGTSVTITFELLDTKTGLVAQLVTPANVFTNMTLVSGQKFTYTLTGQTPGATITYGCYFPYEGNSSRTTDLTYTVGNACGTSTDVTKPVMGTAVVVGTPTVSSANLILTATDDVTSPVISYVANDATNSVTNKALVTDASGNVTVTGLAASTSYNLTITAKDAAGNVSDNSAPVSFTTGSNPVAPTPPTRDATTVIGIYSDAYTCVPNTFQWWASSSSVDVVTGGNNSKKITSTNCFGTQVTALQDISSMKYLHVDIYPTTLTTIQIGIVAPAGNEQHPANTLIPNQWNSFDILLADLKTGKPSLDLTKLTQVGFWGMNGIFYLDNIYFWTDVAPSLVISTAALNIGQPTTSTNTFDITTTSGWTVASDQTWLTPSSTSGTGNATITLTATTANDTYFARTANVTITGSSTIKTIVVTQAPLMPASAPIPTVLAAKVKSIYSDSYTPAVTVTAFDNWWNMNFSDCIFASSDNGKKVVTTAAGNCGSPTFTGTPLDITSMTNVHIDVYPLSTIDIGLQLVTIAHGGSTGWVSLGALTPNQWNSKDIALSNFIMTAKTDLQQVGFVTTATFGTFYMDNLYFYNDGTTALSNVISENGITCYPNPIMNNVTVSAKTEINQVSIHNLLGQTVKSTYIHGLNKTIDLSDLASGNYFITLKLANGQLTTQKLVKL